MKKEKLKSKFSKKLLKTHSPGKLSTLDAEFCPKCGKGMGPPSMAQCYFKDLLTFSSVVSKRGEIPILTPEEEKEEQEVIAKDTIWVEKYCKDTGICSYCLSYNKS